MVAVAYKRRSFTKGSNNILTNLTRKILVFWKRGNLREVTGRFDCLYMGDSVQKEGLEITGGSLVRVSVVTKYKGGLKLSWNFQGSGGWGD